MSSLIRVPFWTSWFWKSTVFRHVWWDALLIYVGTGYLLQSLQGLDALQRLTSTRGPIQHTSSDGLKWASQSTGAKICPQLFGLMILSRYLGPFFTLHHSTILQHLHNCHYKTVTHQMAAVQMQCQPLQVQHNLSLSNKEPGTEFVDDRTTGWDFPP